MLLNVDRYPLPAGAKPDNPQLDAEAAAQKQARGAAASVLTNAGPGGGKPGSIFGD